MALSGLFERARRTSAIGGKADIPRKRFKRCLFMSTRPKLRRGQSGPLPQVSALGHFHGPNHVRNVPHQTKTMVGGTGLEPATPAM